MIDEHPPRWSHSKAGWEKLERLSKDKLTQNNIETVENLTKILIAIVKEWINQNNTKWKQNRPWFDDKYKEVIRLRN